MTIFDFILLQAQPGGIGGFLAKNGQIILLVAMVAVFWLFMIRPQQKKQKEQQEFKNSLKKGDKVVTIGGLHGIIAELKDETVVIEVDRGTKLTFERTAISAEVTKKYAQTATESK
jgi:preprotein translocase subunit YajC